MTAKELAEFLQTIPPGTVVSVYGYEGGIEDVKHTRLTQVLLDVNHDWYYGPHEEDDEDTRKRYEGEGVPLDTAPRVLMHAGGTR